MNKLLFSLLTFLSAGIILAQNNTSFNLHSASICWDSSDYKVVSIAAEMLAEDIERVTGSRPLSKDTGNLSDLPQGSVLVAGTIGQSAIIDELIKDKYIDVDDVKGQWESYLRVLVDHPDHDGQMLVIAGSDRRGTAYGLTTLSEEIGVSPWYFWADVTPQKRQELKISGKRYVQKSPSVQYRGIFINDERFGGWAHWVEETFDKESGQVGPKVYEKVFELLLRLKGNLLWPAMHNGSKAFNANPENARLADDYAIVMGSSHCEQMLRNNEDEWKNAGIYGDFNYLTNRKTMQDYWEERVRTNGQYESIWTLGLRGVHDYPMEGANTTAERTRLMQEAIDDQRDMLQRNIDRPLEEIPQVLCTYEEVLDAYHSGLEIPDDVTLLWSDDKHGYTRNLSNPQEQQRKGGAGIYYHLSYHGDPASWIWLSPLSPAFISTELTKAYTYGARKIWVFNVGDIKPAEKEISFAMELAWDIERWAPEKAHGFIREWAAKTFSPEVADEIAEIQQTYYRLQASGKDSHVWFVEYPESEIHERIAQWRMISDKAFALKERIPEELQDAYFELILYPVHGAQMLNEYQLLARLSSVRCTYGDKTALEYAERATLMFNELNEWTRIYNEETAEGKWNRFFDWRPYHWYYTKGMAAQMATPEQLENVLNSPKARFISADASVSQDGAEIYSDIEGEIPLWIRAVSPVQNFSKAPEDNVFCRVTIGTECFDASATPINNIWHSPIIGPMWSKVGSIRLKKGSNRLYITDIKPEARIDSVFIGIWPPFPDSPQQCIDAKEYKTAHNVQGTITTIPQLGFRDGVAVLPFDTPSYNDPAEAPFVEYRIDLQAGHSTIEIRTLANLHVYDGRDIRYAVSLDENQPETFSIHTGDFTAEWRRNVLHGYSTRSISVRTEKPGTHTLRIYLLDPGLVLQDILIHHKEQQWPKVLLAGDYPDPTILRDGEDFYMTHSALYNQPGFLIWHSRDLMNWEPICRSFTGWKGSVWAPDLAKYGDRYYIYFPDDDRICVTWADDIRGPWSEPIDMGITGIDPGHITDAEGNRYLHLNYGQIIPLTPDGLSAAGEKHIIYDGWDIPEDWVVEGKYLESPKVIYHNGYYYLTSAEGGTAGPPTSHMVISARSRNVDGPWENSPYNPIVHTYSPDEPWWSKGHGTLIDDADGNWWLVYHAYPNGFHSLGRYTLIEPVEWTEDGWFRSIAENSHSADSSNDELYESPNTLAVSDDFTQKELGYQWSFWKEDGRPFCKTGGGRLKLIGKGASPKDGRLLMMTAEHKKYEVETTVRPGRNATAGLMLFYNENGNIGIATDGSQIYIYKNSNVIETIPNTLGREITFRIVNDSQSASIYASKDGRQWESIMQGIDVKDLNHNRLGGFTALHPALYAAGNGSSTFSGFIYKNL